MNTEYIKYLADKLSFPDEAKISLTADSAKINASVKASVLLDDALKAYENSDYAYESIKYRFDGIAESSGVHKYAAAMLILLASPLTTVSPSIERGGIRLPSISA